MDKYCAENSLEKVITGAVKLADERSNGEFSRVLRTK
jgi:hypothetical protein